VSDAAGGLADIVNKATGGLAGKIGTIIAIVIGVILFLVIVGLILKFMNSKKSNNTPN
jgi:ABC-type multidrug transport system permease subunit